MNVKGLNAAALSIRSLSMDAIQKAKSGHPGMPLGCAELAAMIYGEILNHNPQKLLPSQMPKTDKWSNFGLRIDFFIKFKYLFWIKTIIFKIYD